MPISSRSYATKMERNVKRAAITVAKTWVLEYELQRKLLTELRKTWETQEAATETETEINMMKYTPTSTRQAYVDARAKQLLCKANADEKRPELELIQVMAELAKAKTTDASSS